MSEQERASITAALTLGLPKEATREALRGDSARKLLQEVELAESRDNLRFRFRRARTFLSRIRARLFGVNWKGLEREWERGKQETMIFWTERARNASKYPGFALRFDASRSLINGIARHVAPGTHTVRILDVGSGPATNIGYTLPGRSVEVTCIDVMAEPFAKLLESHGLRPPVTPIYGTAEDVGTQFPANHFDIVNSRNALDHVRDPFKALQGMLAVTRADGCVIVWGHVNEGENELYHGYHQWNFCWESDDFVIWRPGFRKSIRALLGHELHFRNEGNEKLYRIVISRRPIG